MFDWEIPDRTYMVSLPRGEHGSEDSKQAVRDGS